MVNRDASWDFLAAAPSKVITDRAVLEPDPETGELVLTTLYPGVRPSDVTRRCRLAASGASYRRRC